MKKSWEVNFLGNFDRRILIFLPIFIHGD